MKQILALLFLSASATCFGQVKLAIAIGGQRVGTASLTQKVLPDGSKSVELVLSMQGSGGPGATIRMLTSYDRLGRALRKHQELKAGGVRRQVTASFPAEGASVVIEEGGKRQTRRVRLVEKADRTDETEFWFIRDQPKPGARSQTYEFNMDKLEWELSTTTYSGRKTVTIGGRSVRAHLVTSERADGRRLTAWLDDKGLPYRLADDRMSMERVFDK